MDIKMNKRFEIKNLPDMNTIRNEVEKLVADLEIGQTLFLKEHGCRTEGEYKKKCMQSGHIMKHSHIGYNTWDTTKECAEKVYSELHKRGSYIDRFGFCLDTLMGLPEDMRAGQLIGTGLMMKNADEWKEIGRIVPVQPHCGDNMIGTLNGVKNTLSALRAGVTTIGNASHYYTYEWPGVDKEELRTIDTIKAIAIMGNFKEFGVIIHSNLDDGYGGQLNDLANLVGWAKIERYYCEELLNGGLGHCYGNLFSNPINRIIFNMAIWEMNPNHIPGSMVYGNTTEFGYDFEVNAGALGNYIVGDIITQKNIPTGHAIVPIPVSEAVRIPTAEEMVAAHLHVDKLMVKSAPCFSEFLNWDKIIAEKNLLVACGNLFFERVMNGLDGLGIDLEHPGEIMGAIKAIGPVQLEEYFGVGKADKAALRGRIPVKSTDAFKDLATKTNSIKVQIRGLKDSLTGTKVIVGTTDVHEFAKQMVKEILLEAGATVFDLGSTVSTAEVLDAIIETECKVVLISTYNGIAYSYGKELLEGMQKRNLKNIGVIMGGLLNEDLDGDELAEDVSGELRSLGINADNSAKDIVEAVKTFLN
ncbi:cobalamin B12-binding domain-containing protein|uniref:B12 binding domain-containing protein n=1 Tax=Dendrosporobacter quercicolus TaxID=146817 RepID=A0A1G9W2R8_9FIRM|nr:cobalamin-dependent protein [Dendrosporobacter quercicolus]NSL47739.1 cobalamin B12-binding domain-containing protein [Dendrosporobacter quercicolus DSM 1736]SDM78603.1 B12 binding domain-containing protein [Dendrosporobacter quercicolus]